jgi:hypothetical protein
MPEIYVELSNLDIRNALAEWVQNRYNLTVDTVYLSTTSAAELVAKVSVKDCGIIRSQEKTSADLNSLSEQEQAVVLAEIPDRKGGHLTRHVVNNPSGTCLRCGQKLYTPSEQFVGECMGCAD